MTKIALKLQPSCKINSGKRKSKCGKSVCRELSEKVRDSSVSGLNIISEKGNPKNCFYCFIKIKTGFQQVFTGVSRYRNRVCLCVYSYLFQRRDKGGLRKKYGPSLVIVGRLFLCRNTGNTAWQETNPAAKHAQTGKGRKHMKVYKKIMNGVAFVEKLILVLSTILIVVLTVGNVLSRKILHQSLSLIHI